MITLGWYLLKVIICSGILCGYYFLALRNKVFHRWNRFYLLASIVISLMVPIMKINIFQPDKNDGTVVQMLQTISYGDEAIIEYSRNNRFQLTTQNITEASYLLVSMIFLFLFFISLYKITKLKKRNPETKIKGISFINTNAKGTPFSFFESIFWNNAIDLHSAPGQQIFNHEIAHIKEKHSYDKIFMNIVLIFFWINPFFWLMKKELNMIHEFIADKEALEDSDINAFSAMILATVFPGQNFSLANNFFYSPIKRRLLMLTKNKNPKVNYISRLLVLPLAAIVIFAFTLKVKNSDANHYDGKTITVIIDAGHGGEDNGAHSSNGINEKDITLAIAKKIAELNSNSHIKIVLSRDNDQSIPVKERVVFAKNNNADLFIAIHVNGAVNEQLNGFSVLVAKNHNEQDQLLGSALINELKKSYKTEEKIGERDRGVWVLDHNVCTAALVQCGFLSNSTDVAFISNSADQEKIARNILDGIEQYASSKENLDTSEILIENKSSNTVHTKDSIPLMYYNNKKVTGLKVYSSKDTVNVKYDDGSKETITKEEANKRGFVLPPPPPTIRSYNGKKVRSVGGTSDQKVVVHFQDGTTDTISRKDAKKAGFILFAPPKIVKDSTPDKVFTKVENEASFPGGLTEWTRYISRVITDSISKFKEADYGTCLIRFIVNTDGTVSDVIATTMKGTELAKVSISALKKGPKWIPASQNGHTVAAYRLQPVTLQSPNKKTSSNNTSESKQSSQLNTTNDDKKVFIKLEQTASFPGKNAGWLKYISRVIQKNGNELISDKDNQGTCKVRFIVDKDGTVSDVRATTMKGTKLADVAVNAIKYGPNWIPGKQNGHVVNSLVIQPVSFKLNDNIGLKNEPE